MLNKMLNDEEAKRQAEVDSSEALAERLRGVMSETGVRNVDLARLCEVSEQAVGQWKKTGQISRDNLMRIAALMGARLEYLLTGRLPKYSSEIFDERGDYHTNSAAAVIGKTGPQAKRIPVLSEIEAGSARAVLDDHAEGAGHAYITLDDSVAERVGPRTFALEVTGESMTPDFRPGDHVIVDPDAAVRPGDIVVARPVSKAGTNGDDGAATLKKYRDRGLDRSGNPVFELVALNPDYASITASQENPVEIVGVVICHQRMLR